MKQENPYVNEDKALESILTQYSADFKTRPIYQILEEADRIDGLVVIDRKHYRARRLRGNDTVSEPQYHRTPNHVSKRQQRSTEKIMQQKMDLNKTLIALVDKEYETLVKEGKVRPRTEQERMENTAKGDPSMPSVQAAKRCLEKRAARKRALEI
jgi:hypothetical protein